jgi:isoleucyl-tRNA synthetase
MDDNSLDVAIQHCFTVGRDIEYVLVKTFNQYTFEPVTVVLSRVLLPKVFGKKYAEGTDEDFANYTPETKVIPSEF